MTDTTNHPAPLLAPCPLCGGTNTHYGNDKNELGERYALLACNDCPMRVTGFDAPAVTAEWNRYAKPRGTAPTAREVEALRGLLAADLIGFGDEVRALCGYLARVDAAAQAPAAAVEAVPVNELDAAIKLARQLAVDPQFAESVRAAREEWKIKHEQFEQSRIITPELLRRPIGPIPPCEAPPPPRTVPAIRPASEAVPGKMYWLRWPGEPWMVATRFIGGWNVATSGYGHTKYDEDTPSLATGEIVEIAPPGDDREAVRGTVEDAAKGGEGRAAAGSEQ